MEREKEVAIINSLELRAKELINDKDFLSIVLSSLKEVLRNTCSHQTVVKKYDSCMCSECDADFGWWCPDSPDHMCYYFNDGQIDGRYYVTLLNREKYLLREDYDPKYESDDWCIFCGQPEERK